jgi:hypothetical protein
MLKKRQIAAMAILLLAAFGSAWLDARSSHYPNGIKRESESSVKHSNQEPFGSVSNTLIFGYPAIDVFTGILAIATLLLAGIALRQLRDSRITQRAYVYVITPSSELRVAMVDGAHTLVALRVWVTWKNSGSTPASPMFARIGATFVPNINDFRFGEPPPEIEQPLVLGPSAQIDSGTIDIAAAHAIAAAHNTGHQFVWGIARYRDNFPGSPEHVIEFCYKVDIEGSLPPPLNACRIRFNLYGEHNRYYDEPA